MPSLEEWQPSFSLPGGGRESEAMKLPVPQYLVGRVAVDGPHKGRQVFTPSL